MMRKLLITACVCGCFIFSSCSAPSSVGSSDSTLDGGFVNNDMTTNIDSNVEIDYMGDLNNKTGAVSFILTNPVYEKGFLVGTYQFENVNGFEPVIKSNIEDDYFENIIDVDEERMIIFDKDSIMGSWTEICIRDSLWNNASDILDMSSLYIETDVDIYGMTDLTGFDYIERYDLDDDSIELFQYNDYYINAHYASDSVFYDAYLFRDDLDCVVKIWITSESDSVDKDFVSNILDGLTIDYVSDISQLNSNKYYLEDAVAKIVSDEFNIHFKKPYMLTKVDSSNLIYTDVLEDGEQIEYEFELNIGFYESDDDVLIANYKNYDVYDNGNRYKFHFMVEDEYDGEKEDYSICIADSAASDDRPSYDILKSLFFE